MDKNKKIILVAAIVVVVAIVAGALFSGILNSSSSEGTTPFSNEFMEGDFVGTVNVVNNTDKWAVAYKDPVHHIEYNVSTCKNASFLVDLYSVQGMTGPEHRTFNNQNWDIYLGQGQQEINNRNVTLQIFMCVADKDNQSYVIYAIFNNNTQVKVGNNLYCDAFTEYIEPLLTSITLKHNSGAPELYDLLGVDKATFDQQADLLKEVKKGNQTAIAQLSG
ncbi:MAG: hypothetical protein Q4P18_06745 [Methanobrevibacter sp.]|uniref:hypothetical protein n=1 Tax=Methanobrevibacter sp. TaxID=66852 RepID=UPI0026DFF17C|nr:hypothetical protein [Methanobrevibacter sp.]MDO5849214.1 hypothetical protein [Methanobrevibacter sp.]